MGLGVRFCGLGGWGSRATLDMRVSGARVCPPPGGLGPWEPAGGA